eukprot:m.304767 g.304767  ORF g.304767 m.304767 type:complete len:139 (-) comp23012_c3_seq20:401-817(-)
MRLLDREHRSPPPPPQPAPAPPTANSHLEAPDEPTVRFRFFFFSDSQRTADEPVPLAKPVSRDIFNRVQLVFKKSERHHPYAHSGVSTRRGSCQRVVYSEGGRGGEDQQVRSAPATHVRRFVPLAMETFGAMGPAAAP